MIGATVTRMNSVRVSGVIMYPWWLASPEILFAAVAGLAVAGWFIWLIVIAIINTIKGI